MPSATYEMLDILQFGDVEIHRATAAFSANGKQYPAGSFVIKTAQPYGGFANTMLREAVYPDLRVFPGGPPEPPYDVTGHTLWMLTGVTVDMVDKPFDAPLEIVKKVAPMTATVAARPKGAYLVDPESYGTFKMVAQLQKANVPVYRAGEGVRSTRCEIRGRHVGDSSTTGRRRRSSRSAAKSSASPWRASIACPPVDGYRLKPNTKVGLWKGANNMPGGWMMWMLEQYGIKHEMMKAQDFAGDLNAKYDVIMLPSGTTKARIVNGLNPKPTIRPNGPGRLASATPAGRTCEKFVENGGTLLAIGSSVETARSCSTCRSNGRCPKARRAWRPGGATAVRAMRCLRDAFSSPARLMQTLRDRVADPQSLFYCPGSLLNNEFDLNNPIAWGMPASWPVFFEGDQAYRLRPGFGVETQVVSRYPTRTCSQSGWLLGEEYLKRPGEHPLVQDRQGLRRHLRQPDRFPDAAAHDVQVDLQRVVPRPVHAGACGPDGSRDEYRDQRASIG